MKKWVLSTKAKLRVSILMRVMHILWSICFKSLDKKSFKLE